MTPDLESRARIAAAYWLDGSPHERTEADALVLARFTQQALEDLATLRHACLAAVGFLGDQSVLTKEHVVKLLADAVREHITGRAGPC